LEFFWPSSYWEEIFKMVPPYFSIFVIIFTVKRTRPFISSWIIFTQGWFVPSLIENWLTGSKEDFKNWPLFYLFATTSPLLKGVSFHLNKLESPAP
jgi:hypothetical protein